MKLNIPKISDSEWNIMKVLWEQAPLTANQIVEKLADKFTWNPRTVKTLINRLVKKNAVGYEQDGRIYLYFPVITEEVCIKAERRSFLNRVYNGALKPMLVSFIEEEKLSAEEIAELKQILDAKSEK
ncbi:BlaI/MecI/CopY family transcriptional regulator [candidate division KSB1 bacterium]|nr:BlaI/MecI/CopY family transcriptional regulator [candidate division KSB1 bacterium]